MKKKPTESKAVSSVSLEIRNVRDAMHSTAHHSVVISPWGVGGGVPNVVPDLSLKAYYWFMAIHRGLEYDEEEDAALTNLGGEDDC